MRQIPEIVFLPIELLRLNGRKYHEFPAPPEAPYTWPVT